MIPAAFVPQASHLWQSTLFAAVAGLLTLALRRNQARVRYWLWLAASYKFLFPFSWLVSIGHQFQWRAATAIMPPAFSAVTDMVSGPIFLTSLSATERAPDRLQMLLFVVWIVWACGFVVVVTGWAREWLRIRAIVRAASPLLLGLPIRVMSTPARLEPGVFGIFHPVLLLPEGIAARLTQAQLQTILAHELCHVRRRDNLAAAIHMLVEALFWFYPLVWWMGARIIDERERACDEEVLQSGSEAQIYAESILRVCELYLESPLTCISGVTGSDLKKRMRRIMKKHSGIALTARKKFLLATAGVVALAVPLVAGVLTSPLKLKSASGQTTNVKVGMITFQGNTVFSNRQLIRTMRNSRPYAIPMYLFDIPLRPKTFDRSRLDADMKDGIRVIYQNDGYFKVWVKDPVLTTVEGGKATSIMIPIEEGVQYRMGRLVIHSADPDMAISIKRDALETAFPLKIGDTFDVGKVRKVLNDYTKLYAKFTTVPETEVNKIARTIDLTFTFVAKSQANLGAASEPARFEAASIKPSDPGSQGTFLRRLPGGLYAATNAPLRALIASAYQSEFPPKGELIFGGPGWIDSELFNIEARAEGNPGNSQMHLMVQSLLEDRFKLVMHHETQLLPIYALELAMSGRTGPQLTRHSGEAKCTDTDGTPGKGLPQPAAGEAMPAYCGGFFMNPRPGDLRETGNRITMDMLGQYLRQSVDRTIVDRTGLSGVFDFGIEFAPERGPGSQLGPTANASNPSVPPSIFNALPEQLGLKLEPQTAPVDVLVIDHVEEPSVN
jgi:uncharacterized protein (TIGR03435 family)